MVSRTLASALKKAKNLGRRGDTMLAHINTREADILKRLGGSGTINPHTGLPEFDNPSMGPYDGPSSGSNSNYTGGSDLGGYSGSGNTTYSSGGGGGGGGSSIGGTTTSRNMGGYISTNSNGTPVSSFSNSSNTNYVPAGGGGSSSPLSSAASSFSTALSAGAGTLANKMTSFSDTLNGILSDAQPSISSLGNQVSNGLISASDQLNAGLMNGYQFASDYISNALSPSASQAPSYTQMAAISGPQGLGQGVDAAISNPPVSPNASPSPDWADPSGYIGGSRLVGYEGSGNTVYSNFGNINDTPAPTRAAMRDYLNRQNANLPDVSANPSATGAINPDVSYALRYNPGTIANAEYIKGSQIKDQFPNVDFGGLSNTDVGRIVTRSIAGEAANEGQLGQQLVGSNILNRLALANQGFNSEGRKQSLSFRDVMKGYDANGFDANRTGPANSVYNNPSASTEWNAFNAMSTVLSPNSLLNQARTNPMAAMQLGAENNIAPEAIANAIQSTHYYNPKYASPSWGPKMTNTAQIGGHLFGNLNTSPNAAQAMNSAMTGFNIPNATPQVAAQVETAPSFAIETDKLIADIRQNVWGSGLYSDADIVNEIVKSGVGTVNPETGKIEVTASDENGDGVVNQQDVDTVIGKLQQDYKVDPSKYWTPIGPPTQTNVAANPMMANMGIAQPPESPDVPMFSSANVADVPAPVGTLAHLGVYDAPIGVNPNLYASPLNLPAQPNTVLSKAINSVIGLTPLGLPNTIAGLFGSGVGDMVANAANVPMTPEEAQAAQERMFASSQGKGGGNFTQVASNTNVLDRVKSKARTAKRASERWKLDALAWGFSEEQLADREVADLIKQVYDLGFIPKTA